MTYPKSALQDAKLRRVYEAKDFDKKGYVSTADIVTWGEKAAKINGVELDEVGRENWTTAGNNYFGNTKSFEEWMVHMEKFRELFPDYLGTSVQTNVAMFNAIDANKDGVVSKNEYTAIVRAIFPDVSDEDVQYGFDMIDSNGDGVLSKEEISLAFARYYWDDEDTKYKHFYGKWKEDPKPKGGIFSWFQGCFE